MDLLNKHSFPLWVLAVGSMYIYMHAHIDVKYIDIINISTFEFRDAS